MSLGVFLWVPGTPQPQGNKTGFVNKATGKVRMVEGRRKESQEAFKDWRGAIASRAREWQDQHHQPLLDEPVEVTLAFYLPKPARLPTWRRWPRSRPDLDKLARACLDALTGTVLMDDGRVVRLVASKTYAIVGEPGVQVEVHPWGDLERETP